MSLLQNYLRPMREKETGEIIRTPLRGFGLYWRPFPLLRSGTILSYCRRPLQGQIIVLAIEFCKWLQ